jgi:hypothetical protein
VTNYSGVGYPIVAYPTRPERYLSCGENRYCEDGQSYLRREWLLLLPQRFSPFPSLPIGENMTVVSMNHKLVNIDRFDTLCVEDCVIYAQNDKREVPLGRFESDEAARKRLFELSESMGRGDKVFWMKKESENIS